MTTLKELKAAGGFVPSKPIPKHISYSYDDTDFEADIFVKKLSLGEYEAMLGLDGDKRSRSALMISSSIKFDGDGKEGISFEDAYRLRPELGDALLAAFREVNIPKKSSGRAKNSSVNSPSPSDAPSQS